MFDFIIDTTEAMNEKFQVIITDHAVLRTGKFRGYVQEIWRDGMKLIPESWYIQEN
jgi:hypothetical protein